MKSHFCPSFRMRSSLKQFALVAQLLMLPIEAKINCFNQLRELLDHYRDRENAFMSFTPESVGEMPTRLTQLKAEGFEFEIASIQIEIPNEGVEKIEAYRMISIPQTPSLFLPAAFYKNWSTYQKLGVEVFMSPIVNDAGAGAAVISASGPDRKPRAFLLLPIKGDVSNAVIRHENRHIDDLIVNPNKAMARLPHFTEEVIAILEKQQRSEELSPQEKKIANAAQKLSLATDEANASNNTFVDLLRPSVWNEKLSSRLTPELKMLTGELFNGVSWNVRAARYSLTVNPKDPKGYIFMLKAGPYIYVLIKFADRAFSSLYNLVIPFLGVRSWEQPYSTARQTGRAEWHKF